MVPAHRLTCADHLCIVSRSCKTDVSTPADSLRPDGEEKDRSQKNIGKVVILSNMAESLVYLEQDLIIIIIIR